MMPLRTLDGHDINALSAPLCVTEQVRCTQVRRADMGAG
jgi:hypothetical protein